MEREAGPSARDTTPIVRTVLFSDVVRSTELIDQHGDVAWFDIVERHTRSVDAAARAHNGMVASFMGDGFMVLFERPADAFECAVRLQGEAGTHGLPGLRIGIDHGDVYRFRSDWWVGLTIHVASRLTDLSQDGGIAISDRSARATDAAIPEGSVDTRLVAIRGLAEPCLVHLFTPGTGDGHRAQPSDRQIAASAR